MVTMTIDGLIVQVPKGTTILEAAAPAHIHIPHLCYLKGLNEIAACRVCCVEVEGERAMVTACNTPVREGMVVHTNSPRARTTRRTNVELILSQHDCKCATCVRSGSCHLHAIANDLGNLHPALRDPTAPGLRRPGPPPSPCTTTTTSASNARAASRCATRSRPLPSGTWRAPAAAPPSTCRTTGSSRTRTAPCAASASPTARGAACGSGTTPRGPLTPWPTRRRSRWSRSGPRGAHRLGGVLRHAPGAGHHRAHGRRPAPAGF